MPTARTIETETLRIAYEQRGPANAPVVLLLHGFPTTFAPETPWPHSS